MIHFQLNHRRQREHHRKTLDTIRQRLDVRCGPLDHSASQACIGLSDERLSVEK
jgi:hypothetical protein